MDGGYTNWTISECSVTCGGGVKTYIRTCTNPPPSNSGKDCYDLGPSQKTESCNEEACDKLEFFLSAFASVLVYRKFQHLGPVPRKIKPYNEQPCR